MSDPPEPWTTWDFDAAAGRYDALVSDPSPLSLYARYDEVLEAVVELAGAAPGRRMLDIGTGTGNLALLMLARGATVVGLDPSAPMLEQARRKAQADPAARFQQVAQPFLRIPYPDSHFDAVASTYAFHHVPPPQKPSSLREMVRVLKPGGRWVVGDLVFENRDAERAALSRDEWLEEEYFARIEDVRPMLAAHNMELHCQQFTPVTWVLWSLRTGEPGE